MKSITIFWFRRDLRIADNCGLFHALKENKNVLPIFIFDENILSHFSNDDPRIEFIYNSLILLNNVFKKNKSAIQIYKGKSEKIFRELLIKYKIKSVFFNRDYEPYAIERDEKIKKLLTLKKISVFGFKDHVIYDKNEITKADGSPYKVYTPYSKLWLNKFFSESIERYESENYLNNLVKLKNEHQILIVPTLDVLDHGVEAKKDIDIQTYNKNISFHIQMKDYPDTNIILQQEIKPQKTELDQWKEAGLKSHYLLEQVIKMGGKKYDNLEPIFDMVQDIKVPEHTEMDKEQAGIPSTFTNVT